MQSLGQRIRQFRLKKGLTQIELAKGLITPSMISQIESDRARPSYKVLVAISTRLDVSLQTLLKGVNIELKYSSKFRLAMGLVLAKEYEPAIQMLASLLEQAPHRAAREELLLELGKSYAECGQIAEAERYLTQLYHSMDQGANDQMLSAVLLQLGKVSERKGDYPTALFQTKRAWEILQKSEGYDPDTQSKVLLQLATLHERVGRMQVAEEYLEQALQVQHGSDAERGCMYLRLAELCDRQEKYEQAEEYANKACVLLEEQASEEVQLEMMHRLTMLQRGRNDWRVTVQNLLSIVEQHQQTGEKTKAGMIYADVAQICLEHGESNDSWAYAEQARMALPDTSPKMGNVHRVLSTIYFEREDEVRGKKHLENAIKIYEQHGMISELEVVVLHMCWYLSNKGEHQGAYECMERFYQQVKKHLTQRGMML